jgi:hypothetical protein
MSANALRRVDVGMEFTPAGGKQISHGLWARYHGRCDVAQRMNARSESAGMSISSQPATSSHDVWARNQARVTASA